MYRYVILADGKEKKTGKSLRFSMHYAYYVHCTCVDSERKRSAVSPYFYIFITILAFYFSIIVMY